MGKLCQNEKRIFNLEEIMPKSKTKLIDKLMNNGNEWKKKCLIENKKKKYYKTLVNKYYQKE